MSHDLLVQSAKKANNMLGGRASNYLAIAAQFLQEKGWDWLDAPTVPFNIGNVKDAKGNFRQFPTLDAGIQGYVQLLTYDPAGYYTKVREAIRTGSEHDVIVALSESPYCAPPYPLSSLEADLADVTKKLIGGVPTVTIPTMTTFNVFVQDKEFPAIQVEVNGDWETRVLYTALDYLKTPYQLVTPYQGVININGESTQCTRANDTTYVPWADLAKGIEANKDATGTWHFALPQPAPVTHNYTMVLTLADTQVAGTWAYLYVKTMDNGKPFAAEGITINENGSDLVTHAKTEATSGEFMWAISESVEKTDVITVTWTDPAGVAHKIVHDTKFYIPKSSATPVPTDDSAIVTIPILPQSDAMDAVFFNITAPNGKDVLVQLDTGAFEFMVTQSAETALGLQKGMQLTVSGVGGQNTAYYSTATFSIQGVQFKDVPCVIDEAFTGTPLFGYKFFVDNGYDLLVSQKHNTITICK